MAATEIAKETAKLRKSAAILERMVPPEPYAEFHKNSLENLRAYLDVLDEMCTAMRSGSKENLDLATQHERECRKRMENLVASYTSELAEFGMLGSRAGDDR